MTVANKLGIAIMTSGGGSAGMNAAVKCAAGYAARSGYVPYLAYDGLRGLVSDTYIPLKGVTFWHDAQGRHSPPVIPIPRVLRY